MTSDPDKARTATAGRQHIDDLLDLFGPLAAQADARPLYWITGDAGEDWCYECARSVARHQRRSRVNPDAIVDGGWDDRREADGPRYCHGCEQLLGFTLSAYGLSEEIAHWLDDGDPSVLSSDQAYEVEALLNAARDFGTDQDISDAVAIGNAMAALLPGGHARAALSRAEASDV